MIEPIISDAHPEFVDEEPEVHVDDSKGPEETDVPSEAPVSTTDGFMTLDYVIKGVFLGMTVGAVVYLLRRRRSSYQKVSEKDEDDL